MATNLAPRRLAEPIVAIARICVFCGSSPGRPSSFADAAVHLGDVLAQRRLGLVYGGASVGTMGRLADAALAAGGEVIATVAARADALTGLRIVEQPPWLRHFTAAFAPV